MVFTANEAKLKNFGTSPAMNVRVRWLKSIEGSADLYTKEHESEISPFHLLPSEITKLQESNISGLLEPGSKDGKARRWLGVLFISWTGVDQNHHYTKQQYSVEWSPNPDPAKTTPVCTILFGDVVRYGTREVRDATSRTE
jgi:hypothetical protein